MRSDVRIHRVLALWTAAALGAVAPSAWASDDSAEPTPSRTRADETATDAAAAPSSGDDDVAAAVALAASLSTPIEIASASAGIDALLATFGALEPDAADETDDEAAAETVRGVPVGTHGGGRLVDGIPFPADDPRFHVQAPHRAFAAQATIDVLSEAVEQVETQFPGTPPLTVGDISTARGGRLSPHVSHQNGLDVDIGPYWKDGEVHPLRAMSPSSLDMERTWALLEALVADESVQYVILDYRLQKVFYEYAAELEWMDEAYLELIFQYPRGSRHREGIIRHWKGHYSHFHVRFYCPDEFADSCPAVAP